MPSAQTPSHQATTSSAPIPSIAELDHAALQSSFAKNTGPGFLALPDMLSPALATLLFAELEAAFVDGRLTLSQAGVGEQARVSEVRADQMGFFTGTEAGLQAASPSCASLIQWCIAHLPTMLAPAHPERPLMIRRAMLARYPAPSNGYHAHINNPAGLADNGRALTLLCYLNPPEQPCIGGELALWAHGNQAENPPSAILEAEGGSGVVFASREVLHMVCPLEAGPARWAISFWLHDDRPVAGNSADLAGLGDTTHSANNTQTWRSVHETQATAQQREFKFASSEKPMRVGIVATVYQAEALLGDWCKHHFDLGFAHILLIFDHLQLPEERACAIRLAELWPASMLSIWDGEGLLTQDWAQLPASVRDPSLLTLAKQGGSSYAVCARQTLNASAALLAAQSDQLGGSPLDWLLHIDADEWFLPAADATIEQHFACASEQGFETLVYLNHEWLHASSGQDAPVFKHNPLQAAANLGASWPVLREQLCRLGQDDQRTYFNAYGNGKAAARVNACLAADGVHRWQTRSHSQEQMLLAGPVILHWHLLGRQGLQQKFLGKKNLPEMAQALFAPLPTEQMILARLKNAGEDVQWNLELASQILDQAYRELICWDEKDILVMQEAGLLFRPALDVDHCPAKLLQDGIMKD